MKKHIAVYGSLKYGFYNHQRFNLGEPITTSGIEASMYGNGSFPWLYEKENSKEEDVREHSIEIYEVDEDVHARITSMELGAGYYAKEIEVEGDDDEKYMCTIYFVPEGYCNKQALLEEYSKDTVPNAYVLKDEITID